MQYAGHSGADPDISVCVDQLGSVSCGNIASGERDLSGDVSAAKLEFAANCDDGHFAFCCRRSDSALFSDGQSGGKQIPAALEQCLDCGDIADLFDVFVCENLSVYLFQLLICIES